MTRIALPQIVSDFPDFEYNEMKQRAENALMQYFEAVTAQDVTILQEGNEDLKEQLRSQIRALVSQEKMGTFYAGKDSSDGDRPVSERSWPLHRDIPVGGGKFSLCDRCSTCRGAGSDHILEQSRYNVDLVYIQNRDLAKGNTDGALESHVRIVEHRSRISELNSVSIVAPVLWS